MTTQELIDHERALERARSIAVCLEQELAETKDRCRALILRWVQMGLVGQKRCAADLAAALDLTVDEWQRP